MRRRLGTRTTPSTSSSQGMAMVVRLSDSATGASSKPTIGGCGRRWSRHQRITAAASWSFAQEQSRLGMWHDGGRRWRSRLRRTSFGPRSAWHSRRIKSRRHAAGCADRRLAPRARQSRCWLPCTSSNWAAQTPPAKSSVETLSTNRASRPARGRLFTSTTLTFCRAHAARLSGDSQITATRSAVIAGVPSTNASFQSIRSASNRRPSSDSSLEPKLDSWLARGWNSNWAPTRCLAPPGT